MVFIIKTSIAEWGPKDYHPTIILHDKFTSTHRIWGTTPFGMVVYSIEWSNRCHTWWRYIYRQFPIRVGCPTGVKSLATVVQCLWWEQHAHGRSSVEGTIRLYHRGSGCMEYTLCRRYDINHQIKRRTCHYSLTSNHSEATELQNMSYFWPEYQCSQDACHLMINPSTSGSSESISYFQYIGSIVNIDSNSTQDERVWLAIAIYITLQLLDICKSTEIDPHNWF